MKRFYITGVLAVVLLSIIVVRIPRHSHPQGLPVGIVVTRCSSPEHLRMIRLLIDGDGSFFINNIERIAAERLPQRIDDIYRLRGEKVLFVEAENSVSYQQVVAAIDTVQSAVPGLKVMLITPSTREDCDRGGILRRITREDRQPAADAL